MRPEGRTVLMKVLTVLTGLRIGKRVFVDSERCGVYDSVLYGWVLWVMALC